MSSHTPTAKLLTTAERSKLIHAFNVLLKNPDSTAALLKNPGIIDLISKEGATASTFQMIRTLGISGLFNAIVPTIMILGDDVQDDSITSPSFFTRATRLASGITNAATQNLATWLPLLSIKQDDDNSENDIVIQKKQATGLESDDDEALDIFYDAPEEPLQPDEEPENGQIHITPYHSPADSSDFSTSSTPLSTLQAIIPLLQQPDLLLAALHDQPFLHYLKENTQNLDIILEGLRPTIPQFLSNLLFNTDIFPESAKTNEKHSLTFADRLRAQNITASDLTNALSDSFASALINVVKTAMHTLPSIQEKANPNGNLTQLGVDMLTDITIKTAICNFAPTVLEAVNVLDAEFPEVLPKMVEEATTSEWLELYQLEAKPVTNLVRAALQLDDTRALAITAVELASDIASLPINHQSPNFSAQKRERRSLSKNAPSPSVPGDVLTNISSNTAVQNTEWLLSMVTDSTTHSWKKLLNHLTILVYKLQDNPETMQDFAYTLDSLLPGTPPDTFYRMLPLLEPIFDMAALQDPIINQKLKEIVHLLSALDDGDKLNDNNRYLYVQSVFLELLQYEPAQEALADYLKNKDNFNTFASAMNRLFNDDAYVQAMLGATGKKSFLQRASLSGTEIASLFKDIKKHEPFLKAYQEWSKAVTDPTRDPEAFSNLCKEAWYDKSVRDLACKVGKGIFFFNLKECFVGFAMRSFFDKPVHNKLHDASTTAAETPNIKLDLAKHLQKNIGFFDEWPSMKHATEERNFYGLQLRKINFKNMMIDGFNFNNTHLKQCQWESSKITNCQFTEMKWGKNTQIKDVIMDIPSFMSLMTALADPKTNRHIDAQQMQQILSGITLSYKGKLYSADDITSLRKATGPATKTSLLQCLTEHCTPVYPAKPLEKLKNFSIIKDTPSINAPISSVHQQKAGTQPLLHR